MTVRNKTIPLSLSDGQRKVPLGSINVTYLQSKGSDEPSEYHQFLGAVIAVRRRYRATLSRLELRHIWRICGAGQEIALDTIAFSSREEDVTGGQRRWLTMSMIGIKSAVIQS